MGSRVTWPSTSRTWPRSGTVPISNHMDFTKKAHRGDEHFIASTVSSIATLDKGFDEGTKS